MPIIAVIQISAEDFILGQVLENVDEYYAELTQFVPTNDQFIPYIWIENEDLSQVELSLRDHPRVARVENHDKRTGRGLYQIEWTQPLDEFLRILMDGDCLVSEASGTSEHWVFELLASNQEDLAALQAACNENDVTIEIQTILRSGVSSDSRTGLTKKQREILELAFERGYFEVPREVTVSELAGHLDISPQAASKRLRRGLANVVEYLLHDDQM